MKKVLSVLLSILMVACLFAGCSGNNKSIDFIYPFSANVKSYDPQIAGTRDEFLIIENTFEGLIRIDDDGTVKNGVADSYSISKDGLTYTFNLKKGIKWNIDTEKRDDGTYRDERLEMLGYDFNPDITANDFVFAFQRACSPITDSPLFASISCIKNANEVHRGRMTPSRLGVKAKDAYTLVITLSKRNSNFLSTLTTAVAMPCNEQFFNATKGRYGLETKYTLFNGQFYLKQILESSYLLKANDFYKGEFPAPASELTLKIIDSENSSKTIELLEKGYYDSAFLSGFDTEKISDGSGITYTPYADTTWAFVLNTGNSILQSKTMRTAFCKGLTRLKDTGKEYLSDAKHLTPPSCIAGGSAIENSIGRTAPKQDIEKSVELWKNGLDVVDTDSIVLTIKTVPEMEEYVKRMLQGIQSGIGSIVRNNKGDAISFTLKIEILSADELNTAIAKRDYDIAFCSFKSESASALSFLRSFADNNPSGFDSSALKGAIRRAEIKDNASTISQAERAILDEVSIIPMLSETSYYASANGVSGIQFHAGTGRVSFVNATRKE